MIIREEQIDIKTLNDREVIIQIIKIIVQEYPGNSCHIMSDNFRSIYFKRCIIASKFVMGIDIYIMPSIVQDSFTKELNIQRKIILEKITQVDFDITLLIKNCGRVQRIHIIQSIDSVNIFEKKNHSRHLQKTFHTIMEKHIRHLPYGAYFNLKKSIIKFDIFMDILDNSGHSAQRGHQSPSDSELYISDSEWHLAINIEYHLLDFSSISGPNYIFTTAASHLDIMIKVDRLRVIHLSCICQINMLDIDIRAKQPTSVINIEYHLLEYSSVNGPNYIFVTEAINLDIMVKADRFIRIVQPSHINLLNNQDIVIKTEGFIKTITVELHLLHISSISQASYISTTTTFRVDIPVKEERFIRTIQLSYIYLLNSLDIDIKAERFIRTFHSSYIHLIKGINRQAPSGDHQQTRKSHHGASSMSTSVEHITHVKDIIVNQMSLDIQTLCIHLTIFSILKAVSSKHLIMNKFIIDNYFHIILSALRQWEALDITHPCPSGNGASKFHCIEQRDVIANIIDSNFREHHLIHRDKCSRYLIKTIYNHIMSIGHQDFFGIIHYIHLKAAQDQHTITNINEVQYLYSIIQNNKINCINYSIFKKKDCSISADTSTIDLFNLNIILLNIIFTTLIVNTINTILDNILEYINYAYLVLLNSINLIQQFNTILQNDNYILDNTTQIDIYNYHILVSDFCDISNTYLNIPYIMDYLVHNIITTESVTSMQLQRLIHNQYTLFFNLQHLSITHHTTSISIIHHKSDIHFQHLINLLEKYITNHLIINSVFNLTLDIIYVNQFIIELYSTIFETNAIKNVQTFMTSYLDIKAYELYNPFNGTDI